MPASLGTVLTYTTIPAIATIIGGFVATAYTPGRALSSTFQHFAAGVVFAAVAVELVPQLISSRELVPLIVGFAAGVGLMLGVRWMIGRLETADGRPHSRPTGLVMAVAVDVFVDGLLVSVGFAAGSKGGILITIALTLELLFLGLATGTALSAANSARRHVVLSIIMLALLVVGGASLGGTVLHGLSGSALVATVAFGTAALLYLVTEELLTEAHEGPDSTLTTAMFFVGFLVLVVLEKAI